MPLTARRDPRSRWPARALAPLHLAVLAVGTIAATTAEYRIGVEDVLLISMSDYPELSVTVPVQPGGKISLPLIGDMVAARLTPFELKQRLVEAYRGYIPEPNPTVIVSEIHSLKVYVLGEVKQPGMLDLQRPVRILQAIALAGGFTEFAGKGRLIVLREENDKQRRLEVNLKRALSGEYLAANTILRPGDTVIVP